MAFAVCPVPPELPNVAQCDTSHEECCTTGNYFQCVLINESCPTQNENRPTHPLARPDAGQDYRTLFPNVRGANVQPYDASELFGPRASERTLREGPVTSGGSS
ncbi:MAG: hypothetical protein ACI8PT_000265 [Gammaproteobacteria bacterium]|jgi:hypothetical protein